MKEDRKISVPVKKVRELVKSAKKADEYYDKYIRLQADFQNMLKRMERQKTEFVQFANEELIVELLTVLDDLGRVVGLAEEKKEDFDAFLKGTEMILAHLYELLKKKGISPMEAKGKLFNPEFQEALMQREEKELPENTVVEELQKGYTLNGRVIRTAKVVTSKK